ncbi:hypothetical protein HZB04_02345 [Candidatus Wolfebacteria bacterium]|nr:hypothetical protein [Candidatus Wolfebacteria bacterium]
MLNKSTLISISFLFLLFGSVIFVAAIGPGEIFEPKDVDVQNIGNIKVEKVKVNEISDIYAYLENFLKWVFGIFLALSTVFIIWAGYYYLIGGEDPENINIAKKRLIWATVAIIVAISAESFVLLIKSFIGGAGGTGGLSTSTTTSTTTQYWQQYTCDCTQSSLVGDCKICCANHGNDNTSKSLVCWK